MAEKKLEFEGAMVRLQEVVSQLEQGNSSLNEAVTLFEEGTNLVKQCTTALTKAEQKVEKLLGDGKKKIAPQEVTADE